MSLEPYPWWSIRRIIGPPPPKTHKEPSTLSDKIGVTIIIVVVVVIPAIILVFNLHELMPQTAP